jgi:hypothetical protein
MLFGHLAVSALEYRYVKAEFVPVMAAAVVPDAVDKVSHYVFGQNATGRMWGHTLLAAVLSSVVVLVLFGRQSAASWALGYLSHLICDMAGVVPWLAPFVTYQFPPAEDFLYTLWTALTRPLIIVEMLLSIWAVLAMRHELTAIISRVRYWFVVSDSSVPGGGTTDVAAPNLDQR